jgi:hypothetical protein
MAEYALSRAAATTKLTGELHAQARQNGRVLDDFYQQRIFAAISLVCASSSASHYQMFIYGKYRGGGVCSLVDLRNVCTYVFLFPDTMPYNAEKSCLDLETSYLTTSIYT